MHQLIIPDLFNIEAVLIKLTMHFESDIVLIFYELLAYGPC